MPSVKIHVDLDGIRLPKEDKYILQGLFYNLMADDQAMSASVHNAAPQFGRNSYKLFTYSGVQGKLYERDRYVDYEGAGELEFRSPDMRLCETVSEAVGKRKWLRLGFNRAAVIGMTLAQRSFFTETTEINMLTPVTVHRTLENGYTRYFQPAEPDFAQLIAENFARKYIACYGQPPEENVLLLPRLVGPEDRIVTHFKGTVVKGCLGRYLLRGRPEYINFLYDCGLGDRNSQGFGMFEVE